MEKKKIWKVQFRNILQNFAKKILEPVQLFLAVVHAGSGIITVNVIVYTVVVPDLLYVHYHLRVKLKILIPLPVHSEHVWKV